jgi:nicotinamide-nucleotide amidase
MTVELITIGAELLSGHTLNTNAQFIGDQLALAGVALARQISIPDDHEAIVAAIRESLGRADWVIVSGGLGPTNDDVTKKAIARVFHRTLVFHDEILTALKERYARLGREPGPYLDTQAVQPADAEFIPNELGSAAGIILTDGGKWLAAVPGVPREMQPMISDHIVPKIAAQAKTSVLSRTWSTTSWPESRLYAALESLIRDLPDVSVAFLPSELGVKLRFSARGADAHAALERFAHEVRPRLEDALYAEEDVGLEIVVGQMLRERQMTISVAESCTGGLLAKRLTDVSGASSYVVSGYVVYANRAKTELLGMDPELIERHGAVSEPVARAMAEGALARTRADCAIAITGIAGPDGGTPEKPVGLIWLAIAIKGAETTAREIRLMGNREMIRARAAQAGLNMLRLRLLGDLNH